MNKLFPDHSFVIVAECRLLASLFAAAMAFTSMSLSAGADHQPSMEIGFSLGIALLLLNCPPWRADANVLQHLRMELLSTVILVCGLCVLISSPVSRWVPYCLTLIGVVLLVRNITVLALHNGFLVRLLKLCGLAALYAFFVGQFVWGEGYRNPLQYLQFANQGTIHTDPVFHQAVISMLKVHGVCSTGMDGLTPFAYHHATHLLAARLCLLLNCSSSVMVCFVLPILLPSVLLYWALRVVAAICGWAGAGLVSSVANMGPHRLILAGFGGFLPVHMLFPFLNWNWSFTMDSQMMAMIIAGMSFLAIFAFDRTSFETDKDSTVSRVRVFPGNSVLLIALCSIAALTATKVTIAHLYVLGFSYWCLRAKGLLGRRVAGMFLSLSTLLLFSRFFTVDPGNSLYFSPFWLWLDRIPPTAWALFLPVNLFFAIAYAMIRFGMAGIRSLRDVRAAVLEGSVRDVELVLLISLTGCAITTIFGGKLAFNAIYYQCSAQFLAIVASGSLLFVLAARRSAGSRLDATVSGVLASTCFWLCFGTALLNSVEKWRDISRMNLQGRGDQFAVPLGFPAVSGQPEMRVLLRQGRFLETMGLILQNTEGTEKRMKRGDRKILGQLLSLGENLTFREKQTSLLWIPRTNREFWDLGQPGRRWLLPMIATGMSELALIDGRPEEIETIADGNAFGFSAYPKNTVQADSALSYIDVSVRARKLGFQWVLELKESGEVVRHECL